MSREAHVRFCESLGVRFLRATRPVAGSFFHTPKLEMVHDESFATREDMRRAVLEYVEVDCNRIRNHSANAYISPLALANKMLAK